MTKPLSPTRHRLALLTVTLAFIGCTSFSPDGGFGPVQQAAKDRLGKDLLIARTGADLDTIDQRVAELLAQPLSADAAVQIALLNNRGLQASFPELGMTEAEVVQSGRLPNPGFVFGRKTRGDEVELECFLAFNIGPADRDAADQRGGGAALRAGQGRGGAGHAGRGRRHAQGLDRRASPPTRRCATCARCWKPPRPAPNWRGAWRRWAIQASCSARANKASRPTPR